MTPDASGIPRISVAKRCAFDGFLRLCAVFISAANTFMSKLFKPKMGVLGAFSAPYFSLGIIVWTLDHLDAVALLAITGAAAAEVVVSAPPGIGIQKQAPFFFCFFRQSRHSLHLPVIKLSLFTYRTVLGKKRTLFFKNIFRSLFAAAEKSAYTITPHGFAEKTEMFSFQPRPLNYLPQH